MMRKVDTAFIAAGGPFYDDLEVGDILGGAPAVTLSEGLAATHQAILGGRMHLLLNHDLSRAVTGSNSPIAPAALACDVSIGQSTLVTQRAIANLFYRGMILRAFPALGETLHTVTTIIGMRSATPRPGRPPRGLVTMRIHTTGAGGRTILDYTRCAMLPARASPDTAAVGETDPDPPDLSAAGLVAAFQGWNLTSFREHVAGRHFAALERGQVASLAGGDVVTSAPELARLTLNLASVHHDKAATGAGQRLVYGGHTIGLAAAQLSRAYPALVSILAWKSCDHLAPVREGDTLHSEITIDDTEALPGGGGLVHFRILTRSVGATGTITDVLDWRTIGLFA